MFSNHLFKRRQLRGSKISCFVPNQYSKTVQCVVKSVAVCIVAHPPAIAAYSPQSLDSEQIDTLAETDNTKYISQWVIIVSHNIC